MGKNVRLPVAFAVLLASVALLPFAWRQSAHHFRYWPGWYIAGFSRDIDPGAVWASLSSAGLSESLSESSATVSYQQIPSPVEVPVADIDRLLPAGDPRRDPFLGNVGRLFQSGDKSLVYLPADRRLSEYRRIFRDDPVLSAGEFLDGGPVNPLLAALVFLAAAGLTWCLTSFGRLGTAVVGLPWLALTFSVGFDILPLSLAGYLLLLLGHRGNPLLRQPYAFLNLVSKLILIAYAAAVYELPVIALFAVAFGASEIAAGVLSFRTSLPERRVSRNRGARRRDHRLFEPVAMAPANREPAFGSPGPLAGIRAAVAVLPIAAAAFFQSQPPAPQALPSAVRAHSHTVSAGNLAQLSLAKTKNSLPDLSDMVASAAYQEGLLSGRGFSLPLLGERLEVREYREDGGEIIARSSTVATYDEEWFQNVINREFSRGVGRLYATLGGAVPVRLAEAPKSVLRGPPIRFARQALLFGAVLLALLPLLFAARGKPIRRGLNPSWTGSRRRAKAA